MIRLGVTGTDTGVGKTTVSRALIGAMRADGLCVAAMKPVETGVTRDGPTSDARILAAARRRRRCACATSAPSFSMSPSRPGWPRGARAACSPSRPSTHRSNASQPAPMPSSSKARADCSSRSRSPPFLSLFAALAPRRGRRRRQPTRRASITPLLTVRRAPRGRPARARCRVERNRCARARSRAPHQPRNHPGVASRHARGEFPVAPRVVRRHGPGASGRGRRIARPARTCHARPTIDEGQPNR